MKRFVAILLLLALAVPFTGCGESGVLEEVKVYQITSEIHSLEISLGAAEFVIREADGFSVESNLKFLSVTEENGVLRAIDKKTTGVTYDKPVFTLTVPEGAVFEKVSILTGAATMTAERLQAKSLKLVLGAGDMNITCLEVEESAQIVGGAGKLTIGGGSVRDLELEMGVGELQLTAALPGTSKLTCGVGAAHITLLGQKDAYRVQIEKGHGKVTVDGQVVGEAYSAGSGERHVNIQGGIGDIDLTLGQ